VKRPEHMFASERSVDTVSLGVAKRVAWTDELRARAQAATPELALLEHRSETNTWSQVARRVRVLVESSQYDRPGARLVVVWVEGEQECRPIAESRLMR